MIGDLLHFLKDNRKTLEKPFFGVLILDSLHANMMPHDYPKRFPTDLNIMNYIILNNSGATFPQRVLNLYRNTSNWIDFILDEALQKIEAMGALQNTIVVLTSDHGQEANETHTNSWAHNSNFTRYQIQTPLAIWGLPGKCGVY